MKSLWRQFYVVSVILCAACTVTFITGYDQVIDNTLTKMKGDFNLHFIRLGRTLQDTDPANQRIENFQDYYDHMEVDLITLDGRTKGLGTKASIVREQMRALDSAMHSFEQMHKTGFQDRPGDNRSDLRNGINAALDAVIMLQMELKATGKTTSDK